MDAKCVEMAAEPINLEDLEQEEETVQCGTSQKTGGNILSFFSKNGQSSGKSKVIKEPYQEHPAKKRKSQVDEHFCVYKNRHKTISRKDTWARKRHATRFHKDDLNYDFSKHILPMNHKTVVKILKEKNKAKTDVVKTFCDMDTFASDELEESLVVDNDAGMCLTQETSQGKNHERM